MFVILCSVEEYCDTRQSACLVLRPTVNINFCCIKIRRKKCSMICILYQVNLHCGKQRDFFIPNTKILNVNFSPTFTLICIVFLIILLLFYFPFLTFQLYTILFLSATFLAGSPLSNVINTTNSSLSLKTLTHMLCYKLPFSYEIAASLCTSIISQFHMTKTVDSTEFL